MVNLTPVPEGTEHKAHNILDSIPVYHWVNTITMSWLFIATVVS